MKLFRLRNVSARRMEYLPDEGKNTRLTDWFSGRPRSAGSPYVWHLAVR